MIFNLSIRHGAFWVVPTRGQSSHSLLYAMAPFSEIYIIYKTYYEIYVNVT